MKQFIPPIISLLIIACAPEPLLIQDVRTLPQEGSAYLDPETAELPLLSVSLQTRMDQTFDSLYFAPWHLETDSLSVDSVKKSIVYYKSHPGWGENKLPRDTAWIAFLAASADTSGFPSTGWPGITTANSDLRALPTNKPVFRDFELPGEGYPFDYLQVSSIPVNTPVLIAHASADRSWFYAVSHIASGWLPSRDLARVDSSFMTDWQQDSLIVITRDEIPLCTRDGDFLFHAPLGSVFPKAGEDSLNILIHCAVSTPDRKAVSVTAVLPKAFAAHKPQVLSISNLASVMDALMGEPYGWGGLFQNRDCSATLKDMFAPFGIMLPRHSSHQARSGFDYIDLAGLSDHEKERVILEEGIPFLTLLWLPGHIMLYIGRDQNRPLVFHNLWGVRTKGFRGKEGRKIVGKSVITTLSPDGGVRHADKKRNLLARIRGMSYVIPPDSVLSSRFPSKAN
jgi:cell wall-associated NlpC family hydrolase